MAPTYTKALANTQAFIRKTEALQQLLLDALNKKKQTPFAIISQQFEKPKSNGRIFLEINSAIEEHNETSNNYQRTIEDARKAMESHWVAKSFDEHWKYSQQVMRFGYWEASTKREIELLNSKIDALELDIRQHRLPAEQFNVDLRNYLGHDELRLQVEENGYRIVRGNLPAKGISEGESTAIALLYFLKSLNDHSFDIKNGIVVLDDPVSSLDSNNLYGALGLIQERTHDSRQLFVLTHNFTFFGGIRNWFHHLPSKDRPARFYMLKCHTDGTVRHSKIQELDKLLEKYESDYHYLFSCVYRAAQSSGTSLEENYNLPNMGRRLLESFLAFRQPSQNDLWPALRAVDFDLSKKSRIYKFCNTFSHRKVVGEPEQDPFLLGEAIGVMQDLLELIESSDSEHYEEMVKLVR